MNDTSDVAIQLLKRLPEKIHVTAENNWHILHYACAWGKGQIELIKYIVENSSFNVDFNVVDHNGWTPLHVASCKGHYEIVDFLLQNCEELGVNVDQKGNDQETPEDLSKWQRHEDILELFGNFALRQLVSFINSLD